MTVIPSVCDKTRALPSRQTTMSACARNSGLSLLCTIVQYRFYSLRVCVCAFGNDHLYYMSRIREEVVACVRARTLARILGRYATHINTPVVVCFSAMDSFYVYCSTPRSVRIRANCLFCLGQAENCERLHTSALSLYLHQLPQWIAEVNGTRVRISL